MQILLISGFLGAGKTTFIKAMIKATGRQFAIIENEFSGLNVDGPLLESGNTDQNGNLKITELTEGCICCSSNVDFRSTVLTISNMLNPDILLVEPSGVAFPSRIIRSIRQICYEQIGLLEPITIIDAEHCFSSRRDFPDYFGDQLKSARHVIVSHSENFTSDDFDLLKRNLGISDSVNMPKSHYSKWNMDEWNSIFRNEKGGIVLFNRKDDLAADSSMDNVSFRPFKAHTPNEIAGLMHELTTGRYGHILRSKGYCRGINEWFRFDYVDGSYIIGECEPMADTRAVVIGSDIDKNAISDLFNTPPFMKI